jgi:hypothetical protein
MTAALDSDSPPIFLRRRFRFLKNQDARVHFDSAQAVSGTVWSNYAEIPGGSQSEPPATYPWARRSAREAGTAKVRSPITTALRGDPFAAKCNSVTIP